MSAEFLNLVTLAQAGALPPSLADTLADVTQRHSADIAAALERLAGQSQPGDPCPAGCGGELGVRTSRPSGRGGYVIQYLACRACRERPDPPSRIVPAAAVPGRRKRI